MKLIYFAVPNVRETGGRGKGLYDKACTSTEFPFSVLAFPLFLFTLILLMPS